MSVERRLVIFFSAGVVFGLCFDQIILRSTYTLAEMKPVDISTLFRKWDPGNHSANAEKNVTTPRLATQVRLLCSIITGPSNHEKKAIHVKNTWAKRCNERIFVSSQSDKKLGAIALPNVKEGRDWLWAKTKEAFKYVWEHHRDEADWFMKADDDTYVIVENLHYLLNQFNPQSPIYFGCHFKRRSVNESYMSGGCGYVLSKEALRRLFHQGLPDKTKCDQSHGGPEDIRMAQCLKAVGVEMVDSRDTFGRDRFFQFQPDRLVINQSNEKSSRFRRKMYYGLNPGLNCCSETAISFHQIPPAQMYVLEYLIYRLRISGGVMISS